MVNHGGISKIFFQTTFHHHFQARNAKISPLFHFDRGNNGWICHILCVKDSYNKWPVYRSSTSFFQILPHKCKQKRLSENHQPVVNSGLHRAGSAQATYSSESSFGPLPPRLGPLLLPKNKYILFYSFKLTRTLNLYFLVIPIIGLFGRIYRVSVTGKEKTWY